MTGVLSLKLADCDCWCTQAAVLLVAFLGLISTYKVLCGVLGFLWSFVRPRKVKSYGKWAVVTGATDGIGLAYCQEFASNGLNVVLISRTQSKLDECAKDIKTKYPKVEVKTIQADFDKNDASTYSKVASELSSVPVGILVNNVGRSYPHAEYFQNLDEDLIRSLIDMNVVAVTNMTKIVVPGMLERKKGCIINITSAAGVIYTGNPLYAVYSATKAYVDFFSRSLNLEYAGRGVDVTCHVPYFVTSKLSKLRHTSLTIPNPRTFARASVACMGYGVTVVPFTAHAVQHFLIENVLPRFLFAKFLMSTHNSIRKKALKKNEKSQ